MRNVTRAAADGQIDPVVGRDAEIDVLLEILASRRRSSPILVGERGTGRTAIVEGLAQRIADGNAPSELAERQIFSVDPAQIGAWVKTKPSLADLASAAEESDSASRAILFLDDLAEILAAAAKAGAVNAAAMLTRVLEHSSLQCIASCTPAEFRELTQTSPRLAECFRVVHVRPLDEKGTLAVLQARRASLEKFHGVAYTDEALEFAVKASASYLPADPLPEKALELLDAAGARAKLSRGTPPPEIAELQKRLRFIAHRLEAAVANHEFEKARFYSDEERKERESLRAALERLKIEDPSAATVGRREIEAVIAG